jgi:hypothetical protein
VVVISVEFRVLMPSIMIGCQENSSVCVFSPFSHAGVRHVFHPSYDRSFDHLRWSLLSFLGNLV